jgi:membrane protease YdiL (CAAX protease family)
MQEPIDQPAVTDSEEPGQLPVLARDGSIHLTHLMPPPFVAAALPLSPEERRFRVGDLAVLLVVAFGPMIVASISALWLGRLTASAKAVVPGLANLVVFELSGLILLAHLLFRQRRSFKSIGLGFSWRDLPLGVLLVVASYLASAACWLAIAAITSAVAGHAPAAARAPDPLYVGVAGLHALVWAVVLVNPWFEELIMRAYTMSEITALGGSAAVAVAASVGLQILYHLYQGVPRALAMAGGSLVCSLFYLRYRRIMPVILAHLVMDVAAVSHIARP